MTSYAIKRTRRHACGGKWKLLLPAAALLLLGAALFLLSRPALLHSPEDNRKGGPDAMTVLDVPFLSQLPEFPTGCESVSAVMALQYLGIDLSPGEFVDRYLPLGDAPHHGEDGALTGCDPSEAFPGDPRSESGWGCFAPVILSALEQASQGRYETRDLTGESLETLCSQYLADGTPVLVWVTIDMAPASEGDTWLLESSGEPFTWIEPLHCAVLVGWDDTSYYLNDPLAEKNTAYPRDDVETAYKAMGSQAIALLPQ